MVGIRLAKSNEAIGLQATQELEMINKRQHKGSKKDISTSSKTKIGPREREREIFIKDGGGCFLGHVCVVYASQ